MGSSKILHIILILAFEIGTNLRFELVGVFTLGWILALVYTCLFLWRSPLLKEKNFRTISLIYLAMIVFQIMADFMVDNTLTNGMKGAAVGIVSYANLFFLSSLLCKNQKLTIWLFLGMALEYLIRGVTGDYEGEDLAEEAMEGENATFLKFVLAPLLTYLMLCLASFIRGTKATYIFMYFGVFLVLAGARSSGLTAFLIGVTVWIVRFKKKNVTAFIRTYSLPILAVLYGVYAIYVTKVISGELTTGNNQQLAKSDNPYNPLEIIKYSRTDAWMGLVAWADKPLWGHGSWPTDETHKYHIMMAEITGNKYVPRKEAPLVPGHSVIFGKAVCGGVFSMISVTMLIMFFVRRQYKLLNHDSRYTFINAYCLFSTIWHSLFSPLGHIRDTFPQMFAVTLALWLAYSKENQQQTALPPQETPSKPLTRKTIRTS